MQLTFYKYQGTGNDFVILNNLDGRYNGLGTEQVNFLCDRRFGIGGDGLMLLNKKEGYDFEMKYYNADGRESTMCGNGGRCLVQFAHHMGILKSSYTFLAIDGVHEATIQENGNVALKMNDVSSVQQEQNFFIVNTGSPHYVQMVEDVMGLDVFNQGRQVRYSAPFQKEGINVNFVEKQAEANAVIVRTYERGVEDETLSCGTGVTAAALVNWHNENGPNKVSIKTKGGSLSVCFDKIGPAYNNIWLIGPAKKVFEGTITLEH